MGFPHPDGPELVGQLGVARNTVREAVRALAHNGLLDIRQGSGTYVVATSELAGVMQRRFAGPTPAHRRAAFHARESSAAKAGRRAAHGARSEAAGRPCSCGARRRGSRGTRRRS